MLRLTSLDWRVGSPPRNGPLETLPDVKQVTSAWVSRYTSRLTHRLGRRPPAQAEMDYDYGLVGHPSQAHT